jgi:hypothetical protein
MKTKLLIISFLIVALLGAFTLKANAQDSTLIADETTLNYTKTEAKITCDNEKVFNELFKTHGTLFKRFTCTWKSDRYGRYKHYIIYLAKGDAELIVNWAKTNL